MIDKHGEKDNNLLKTCSLMIIIKQSHPQSSFYVDYNLQRFLPLL